MATTEALTGWTNSAGWTNLGSSTSGIAVSRRGQIVDAWESRGDRALYRNSFNGSWSGWSNVNAGPLSARNDRGFFGAPSVLGGTSDQTNVVEVVVKDLGSEIQWATWNNVVNSWISWQFVGTGVVQAVGSPVIATGPAGGSNGEHLWVFTAESPNRLAYTRKISGGWSAWGRLTGPAAGIASSPAAVGVPVTFGFPTAVEIIVRGQDGRIYERSLGGCPGGGTSACFSPTWQDFGLAPGGVSFVGTPTVAFTTTSPTKMVVFALGSNGNVYSWTSAGWTLHRAAVGGGSSDPTLAAQFRGTTAGHGLDLLEIDNASAVEYSTATSP